MRPDDAEAHEAAAWRSFVQQLADHLAAQWPAMPERLGERYLAFVDLAVQHALDRGLAHAASVARFVNLWFVWGPGYHDKPGFEWAQALLAAPRAPVNGEWQTAHQLVQRSVLELQRLPGSRIEPQALTSADARVIERFAALGRQGQMQPYEPAPTPRRACDLEAIAIRLPDDSPAQQHYQLSDDNPADAEWRRVAVAKPAPLRLDADHPLPAQLALLSHAPGDTPTAPRSRLQVRVHAHAVCDSNVHPVLGFSGPHGRWVWTGHETRAASWPVAARAQPTVVTGPGSAIAEETSPELQRLEIEACGLRDSGAALGPLQLQVSVWPAAQWWLELQRAPPQQPQSMLPGQPAMARSPTRCRVERDGLAQDSGPLKKQFEDGLDDAAALGLHRLAAAWEAAPGMSGPRLDALLGLLVGRASLSWGWALGPDGLAGPALMRVLAQLDLSACLADLQLGGELLCLGSRSRVSLQLAGQAPLRQTVRRETAVPPLADVMAGVVARWRWPVLLSLDALACESGCLLQISGPTSGALVGEAGLRPSTRGHSGWAWYLGLRLEPVVATVQLSDPLLGQQTLTLPLLPALTLVDWSLG